MFRAKPYNHQENNGHEEWLCKHVPISQVELMTRRAAHKSAMQLAKFCSGTMWKE